MDNKQKYLSTVEFYRRASNVIGAATIGPVCQLTAFDQMRGLRDRVRVITVGQVYRALGEGFPEGGTCHTIIDPETMLRAPENLVFSAGAETDEECAEMLGRLERGETALSVRRDARLVITRIEKAGGSAITAMNN